MASIELIRRIVRKRLEDGYTPEDVKQIPIVRDNLTEQEIDQMVIELQQPQQEEHKAIQRGRRKPDAERNSKYVGLRLTPELYKLVEHETSEKVRRAIKQVYDRTDTAKQA